MQRKKTLLLISIANIVISIGYLTKLTIDLTNNKKKIEDLYLELAFAISVLMLSVITTILLAKETKHEKIKHSDSSLSLSSEGSIENDSDSEEEIEVNKNSEGPTRISTNDNNALNNDNTTLNNKKVKEDNSKHHSIINKQQNEKYKKDQIAAITLPEGYTIEKYKELEGGKCEILREDKNGIITLGHEYELINLQLKEDGFCIITLQNQQDKNVFLELKSSKIYMHAKEAFVKSNAKSSKEVKNYLHELKANNDIIILLKRPSNNFDIFDKLGKLIAEKLDCVTWDKKTGIATIEGSKINKQFTIDSFKEGKVRISALKSASFFIKAAFYLGKPTVNIKEVLVDIIVNNYLIQKEPEVVKKPADNTDQTSSKQTASSSNENTITSQAEVHSPSQPETNDRQSVISGSIETKESTELTKDDNKKQDEERSQSCSMLSSQIFGGSTKSIDSSGKQKNDIKAKAKILIDEMKQKGKKGLNDLKDKFVNHKGKRKSEETPLLSSVDEAKTEQGVGVNNQGFE